MTEDQFQYADDILNLFGKSPEGTVFNVDQILEHTGLTKEQFEIGMRIIKPKKFLKLDSKPMETGGDPFIITGTGQEFYNETSFVKEHKRRHQQPEPRIWIDTRGGSAIGIGNVGNTDINYNQKEDKKPWYEGIVFKTIMTIVATVVAAFVIYYLGWSN